MTTDRKHKPPVGKDKNALARRKRQKAALKKQLKNPKTVADILDKDVVDESKDPSRWEGLTERQKLIVRLRLRGVGTNTIGSLLSISAQCVTSELRKIREKQGERISKLEQNIVLGESISVYEEVSRRAWEMYHTQEDDPGTQLRALRMVMASQEKQNKLLMDLGVLRRAARETNMNVEVTPPPLLRGLEQQGVKEEVILNIIESQFSDLEEPEPELELVEMIEELEE